MHTHAQLHKCAHMCTWTIGYQNNCIVHMIWLLISILSFIGALTVSLVLHCCIVTLVVLSVLYRRSVVHCCMLGCMAGLVWLVTVHCWGEFWYFLQFSPTDTAESSNQAITRHQLIFAGMINNKNDDNDNHNKDSNMMT